MYKHEFIELINIKKYIQDDVITQLHLLINYDAVMTFESVIYSLFC